MTLLIIYFLAGFLAQKVKAIPASTSGWLNKFILYISLPAIIFLKARDIPLTKEAIIPALMPVVSFIFSFIIFHFWGTYKKWPKGKIGCLILLGGLGNTSFLGFPLIEYFYGKDFIVYGLMVDQGGSFITFSTLGLIVASLYSGGPIDYARMAKNIFLFPTTLALVLALLLGDMIYPNSLTIFLNFLGSLLGPVALASIGFQIKLGRLKEHASQIAAVLTLKMIIVPLVFLGIALCLFDVKSPLITITLFEAAMPPMITAGIIAQEYKLAPDYVPSIVGCGILLVFALAPLWYYLLNYL